MFPIKTQRAIIHVSVHTRNRKSCFLNNKPSEQRPQTPASVRLPVYGCQREPFPRHYGWLPRLS